MVCCGTKKGVEKLQAIGNIFSFTFVAACLPAGKFLALIKGFVFSACLSGRQVSRGVHPA